MEMTQNIAGVWSWAVYKLHSRKLAAHTPISPSGSQPRNREAERSHVRWARHHDYRPYRHGSRTLAETAWPATRAHPYGRSAQNCPGDCGTTFSSQSENLPDRPRLNASLQNILARRLDSSTPELGQRTVPISHLLHCPASASFVWCSWLCVRKAASIWSVTNLFTCSRGCSALWQPLKSPLFHTGSSRHPEPFAKFV